MLRGARVAVVVPAFDEALLIGRTLESIPPWVDQIVVVDDASRDETAERVMACGDRRVRLERHAENRGVGAAIATGYRLSFEGGADVAAVMAGDAQMDARDLEALLDPVLRGDAGYARGDRLSHPEARARMPFSRFVGNHALTLLTRVAVGRRVRDSQTGYTAIARAAWERIGEGGLWPRYGYPNDLIGRALLCGVTLGEVVVRPVYGDERSGIGLRHALVVIPWVLARVFARRVGHALQPRQALQPGARARGRLAGGDPISAPP